MATSIKTGQQVVSTPVTTTGTTDMTSITGTTDTTGITKVAPAAARTSHLGRRVRRTLARVLGVMLALIASLVIVGASYEAIAALGDAKAYPPPGRLVDIGGYRLHIQCVGTASAGRPTVVLDAGLGGTSLDWDLVQKEIGETTQVCAYDRAGMGWSDPGPLPRTPEQIARELYTLLTNAGISGPYILVGHSLAGKNIRLFAMRHPSQVVGMVLIDARSEYVDARTSASDNLAFEQAIEAQGNMYGVLRRLGIVRLIGAGQSGSPAMSDKVRTEIALFTTGRPGIEAQAAEAHERAANDAQLQAAPSLGEMPLIVLGSGPHMTSDAVWSEAQQRMAALSTNGRLIVVENSGHAIQVEQPKVVIDAVRQVVGLARVSAFLPSLP